MNHHYLVTRRIVRTFKHLLYFQRNQISTLLFYSFLNLSARIFSLILFMYSIPRICTVLYYIFLRLLLSWLKFIFRLSQYMNHLWRPKILHLFSIVLLVQLHPSFSVKRSEGRRSVYHNFSFCFYVGNLLSSDWTYPNKFQFELMVLVFSAWRFFSITLLFFTPENLNQFYFMNQTLACFFFCFNTQTTYLGFTQQLLVGRNL